MKHFTNVEDWNMLNKHESATLWSSTVVNSNAEIKYDKEARPLFSIGQLIDYLGSSLTKMEKAPYSVLGGWRVVVTIYRIQRKELIDALWQAVIRKLNSEILERSSLMEEV